jgi:hypothetical protein
MWLCKGRDGAGQTRIKKITNRYQVSYSGKQKSFMTQALCLVSSETVSFLRPFFLLAAITPRPLDEDIRSLNPCLFLFFLLDG